MAVLIKNMDMPRNCKECQFSQAVLIGLRMGYECRLTGEQLYEMEFNRHDFTDCPLEEGAEQ